ncbi:MAG: GntR family transcriptional regulator [Rhizobiales bacterium]|nr:GntR family transcriptional regulator [Hyphomicrobiales bacterium]MBA69373.1 GntR family transcriptional regulator [Hyphomicrobiales bacterium]|tara:strand:+ start:2088 stop:2846 length:759 start_codon:yes stop_codon:yes gene_type:complete
MLRAKHCRKEKQVSDDNRSRKANCLEDLQRRILTLDLEPGSYLDETRIAEAYMISRPPLREVLRQLAGDGYVVLHENRGAQVAPMTHKTLRNFFVAAPMIYAAVTRLAAENARAEQIMRLKDTQLLFRAAIRDGDTPARALMNERFHAIIGEMADNEFLVPSLRRLLIDHTRIGMTFYSPRTQALADQRAVAAEQHDQFIALIESGDADAASELAVAHWELSRAEIESFVTPKSIQIPLGHAPGSQRKRGNA